MTLTAHDPTARRMQELEARADIESLEELQQRRRDLIEQVKHLRVRYGHFGTYDDVRKQRLELAKIEAARRLKEEGERVTDKSIDAAGYADPAYRKLLDDAEREKAMWVVLENQITEIEERIRNRELMLRAYTVEVGLR